MLIFVLPGDQAFSAQLDLAPQTLSGQIASLEASLGVPLFQRVGRRLELTETGRMVSRYADQIFTVGKICSINAAAIQKARINVGWWLNR